MSDDQNVNREDFSDEMREAAQTCARIIKEHDFAVMGYEAEKVIDIYAGALESGRIGPGEAIFSDDAASLIREEFEELYGQSPEEARAACEPQLDISGSSEKSECNHAKVDMARVRMATGAKYAQEKKTAYFELQAGPKLEYAVLAEISRDPSPKGFEDGRIQFLSVVKNEPIDHESAPELSDGPAYESWLKSVPEDRQVARIEEGALVLLSRDDPHVGEIIDDMARTFSDDNRDFWLNEFETGDERSTAHEGSARPETYRSGARQKNRGHDGHER